MSEPEQPPDDLFSSDLSDSPRDGTRPTTGETTIDVRQCARCGEDHLQLTFRPLSNPADEWNYWAQCPASGEPILLRVLENMDFLVEQQRALHRRYVVACNGKEITFLDGVCVRVNAGGTLEITGLDSLTLSEIVTPGGSAPVDLREVGADS